MATRTAELSKANRELQATNRELETFAYSVSHDLRAPLRAIEGFNQLLLEEFGPQLASKAHTYLGGVRAGAQRMSELIQALLALSHTTRGEITPQLVDLSALARTVIGDLRRADPEREVEIQCVTQAKATGDTELLRIALENLFSNAWKFTAGQQRAVIEFGVRGGLAEPIYFVRDNGAGFDMTRAKDTLFMPFQRFHKTEEFLGTGIGLATVRRIIARHGG